VTIEDDGNIHANSQTATLEGCPIFALLHPFEVVRKCSMKVILERSKLMRQYRIIR
jgi:hypothetical protein